MSLRVPLLRALAACCLAVAAAASAHAQGPRLFGFIDRTGQYVIPPTFDSAGAFHGGVAVAKGRGDGGLIDRTGAWVEKPKWYPLRKAPPGGLFVSRECYNCAWVLVDSTGAAVRTLHAASKSGVELHHFKGRITAVDSSYVHYWQDDSGHVYMPDRELYYAPFDDEGFGEGLMPAMHEKSRRWGYLNERFEPAIPFSLDVKTAYRFAEGRAKIWDGSRYGAIDRTGKVVIKPKWKEMSSFSMGLALIRENDKAGFIDTTGALVIAPQFDWTTGFYSNGLAVAQAGNKYLIIDRTGRVVLESPRQVYGMAGDSLVVTSGLMKWHRGLMDLTGRMITDSIVGDEIGWFSEGLAVVSMMSPEAIREAAAVAKAREEARKRVALEKQRQDSIKDWLKKHPGEVEAAPPGTERWVWYIVRQSVTVGTRDVQVGGMKMKMRSTTWYVDWGFVDAKPGTSAGLIRAQFEEPRRSLTVTARQGVFPFDSRAGTASSQALKAAGVGKTDADYIDDNYMGRRIP